MTVRSSNCMSTDVFIEHLPFYSVILILFTRFSPVLLLLTLFVTCTVCCNKTSTCSGKDKDSSCLDVLVERISKATCNIPTCCNDGPEKRLLKAVDCADVLEMGHNTSGIYKISPMSRINEDKSLEVYCDMDTSGGGWTVIQRRGDFQRAKDYFFRSWKSYKEGFGDLETDFWLGNDNIFALTNQKLYSARFDMKDVEQNHRYALYDKFWIDDESNKYMLHVSDYSGDANDSLFVYHNNQKFSTKDQDNDIYKDGNCAATYKGAWWYSSCVASNLNGLYHKGKHESIGGGVNWLAWKGLKESLEWTEIKIRPKHFRPSKV